MHPPPPLLALIVGSLLAAPALAREAPSPGDRLPDLSAKDVTGRTQRLHELLAGPTLVIAITSPGEGDAMKAWFEGADTEAPFANRVSIISLGLPFFVGDGYARGRARERVPPRWRHFTLFDGRQTMTRALGLKPGKGPYAFAVDSQGRVLAAVRGGVGDADARLIWQALANPPP